MKKENCAAEDPTPRSEQKQPEGVNIHSYAVLMDILNEIYRHIYLYQQVRALGQIRECQIRDDLTTLPFQAER